MSTDTPSLPLPPTGPPVGEADAATPAPPTHRHDGMAHWPALVAGEVLAAWGGITVRRLPDWLPSTTPEPPSPDQPLLPLPGLRPLADLSPAPGGCEPRAVPTPRRAGRRGAGTRPAVLRRRGTGAALAGRGEQFTDRLLTAAAVLLVECLSGRRPLTHLNGACAQQARLKVRLWPRGPGWSRVQVLGPVGIQTFGPRIEGVVLLDHCGHRMALGLAMRRQGDHWHIGDVDLVLNGRLTAMLTGSAAAA